MSEVTFYRVRSRGDPRGGVRSVRSGPGRGHNTGQGPEGARGQPDPGAADKGCRPRERGG